MTDNDDNLFDGFEGGPEERGPKKSGSRTFIIAILILGIVLVVFVAAVMLILPKIQSSGLQDQTALINAQNTATSLAVTQFALTREAGGELSGAPLGIADLVTPTPDVVLAAGTPTPAAGKAIEATQAPGIGAEAAGGINRTATIAALITQAAVGYGVTSTPYTWPVSSALPNTGFIDEVGIPGMVGMGLVLITVVFFVRRFRLTGR